MMTCNVTTTWIQPRWMWCLDIIVRYVKGFLSFLKDLLDPRTPPARSTPGQSWGGEEGRACALVLDASYSMQDIDWKPSRLEAAKDAAKAFAFRLADDEPGALIAVVAYGSTAKVICRPISASELSRIGRAIDQIDAMGSTNMKAGMKRALQLLDQYRDRVCQVILLSDGHNTGRSPRQVAEELKQFAVVECVGIGGRPADVDEALLKALASRGPNGTPRYRWIGDKENLVRHFRQLAGRITRA